MNTDSSNLKRALVTGGAGFIGSNVVKKMTENGFMVTVYDNLSTGYLENLKGMNNCRFIEGDIMDKDKLIKEMAGHEVVMHLAANIGNVKSLNDPWFDSTINILGTLNVLEACRLNNIKKIVYSSSAAIFGELKYQPIDEKHPLEPDSPYGVSKLAAEKHCLWFGRSYNISVVALRYFNVYGVNQRFDLYGNVIPIWANLLLSNNPIVIYDDGEQTRDLINVEDVAKANYLAAISDAHGQFNLGSGESITINHLADIITKVFKIQTDRIYKPKRIGEVRHCKADISKVKKELGFLPGVNIEDGLIKYFEWFKKYGFNTGTGMVK